MPDGRPVIAPRPAHGFDIDVDAAAGSGVDLVVLRLSEGPGGPDGALSVASHAKLDAAAWKPPRTFHGRMATPSEDGAMQLPPCNSSNTFPLGPIRGPGQLPNSGGRGGLSLPGFVPGFGPGR